MGLKVFKLKKKDLKSATLLQIAIRDKNNGVHVNPSDMFLSKKDYNILTKNTKKTIQTQVKYRLSKNKLDLYTQMEMLNLGPNQTLEDIIKSGYLLVITRD